MAEEVRVVLVGDNWAPKEKLSDNLMFRMPGDQDLKAHTAEIAKLLGRTSLDGLEFHKGKGKPPAVQPGVKVNLSRLGSDLATKTGLVVLFIKEKAEKEKEAPKKKPTTTVKVLFCGDNWQPTAKLADNLMLEVKKDQILDTAKPEILKMLKLSSLDGYELCKGRGKAPEITAGSAIDMSRTPESLGLNAAAFLYVRKVKKEDAAKPKEVRQAIYQVGAKVELQDEETEEWMPGTVMLLHPDGSYNVTLEGGRVEKFIDADDLRVNTSAATAAEKPKVTAVPKEQQMAALKVLIGEFPSKSVPEIGSVLKGTNFDVDESRTILKASMPAEAPKADVSKFRRRREEEASKPSPLKSFKVKLEKKEELGIEFFSRGGKVIITKVDGGACGRANVEVGVLVRMAGEFITSKEELVGAVQMLRKEEITQFDMEIDMREEARIYEGCIVDVHIDGEWERGFVCEIHTDEDDFSFDVTLEADGEIEDDLDISDLRVVSEETLHQESLEKTTSSGGGGASSEPKKGISGTADKNDPDRPSVKPPSSVMPDHSGVMKKKGNDMIGLYKLRRFALYGKSLYYYKLDSKEPMGVLDLRQSLAMDDPSKGLEYFGLGGKNLERVYHFMCGSEAEKREWMGCLQEQGVMVKKSS
eukprot:TRINITY_DN10767_c0_g2_i2.p1 TRINITY_DN10767_c0_g2~~TRINITY_DN10767_c0_g2_i2.p1  ORF type:complete len:642 (+),score=325.60 TRINITY_DN10767_c0_g2_i2:45-1970(+)